MREVDASDLFLRAGSHPTYRIGGELARMDDLPAPDEQRMRGYRDQILTQIARERFEKSPDIDVAYTMPAGEEGGRTERFRINLFMQQGMLGLAARLIPSGAVDFQTLNLPPAVEKMADARAGLILVVGPTGCGKSTTLASLVHRINSTRRAHIMTIEDPIEFVHDEIHCLIHQRQVGYDTESFPTALKHVVRQSPDVILIGEMRDAQTMTTALNAALTGHLILTTLHTTNVVQSIDRMLNYFPPDARGQAQTDLAATLVGMMSMRLLRRTGGGTSGSGRIPACEVLTATPTVRRMITEGEFGEIYDVIKRGEDTGMSSLNQSLVGLSKEGLVREEEAVALSPNPDEFRLNMEGMYTGIDSIDLRTELAKKDQEQKRKKDQDDDGKSHR